MYLLTLLYHCEIVACDCCYNR